MCMNAPPTIHVDPKAIWQDPYPVLEEMRANTPICFVPELNAVLFTRRDDISECEKNIEVFSSSQSEGLMTKLMGENMMRKDGEQHQTERRQIFPAVSPKTVRNHWKEKFSEHVSRILEDLKPSGECDLVHEFAMPVSAEAMKTMTGLTQIKGQELDLASQAMIDGISNYIGDKAIEAHCNAMTAFLDQSIDERVEELKTEPDISILGVLLQTDQPMESIRANIKLTISGGQNEPRDAIAGCVWALLTHSEQLEKIKKDEASWLQAFEEYVRWISPIGMSPREIAKDFDYNGIHLEKGQRIFFMFSSGNRDETIFDDPQQFDITRDTSKSISFGAGPHFCAGAAASRTLIAEVALPMLFDAFPNLQLAEDVAFGGWAFRGPLKMPVNW